MDGGKGSLGSKIDDSVPRYTLNIDGTLLELVDLHVQGFTKK